MSDGFDDFEDGGDRANPFDPRRLIGALHRRRKIILIVGLLGLPLAPIPALMQNEIFSATASIAIEQAPDVMKIGRDVERTAPTRNPLERAQAILMSDRVIGRVVDQLPAPETRPPGVRQKLGDRIRRWAGASRVDREPDLVRIRQARIRGIRSNLTTSVGGGQTILKISAVSSSPEQAAWIANSIAEAYVAHERDEKGAAVRDALNWLAERTESLKTRVRAKEEALGTLAGKLGGAPGSADEADAARARMFADLEAARLELSAIEQRLGALAPRVGRNRDDQEAQRELLQQLETSTRALEAARLRYTRTHPEVQRLTEVVENLRQGLGGSASSHDPLYEDRLSEYRQLQGQKGGLEARIEAVRRALNQSADSVEVTDTTMVAEYDRLDRELTIERELLQGLMQRRNETIVSAANGMSAGRILDPAVTPSSPLPMRRFLYLLMGLVAALGLPLALAIGLELIDGKDYEGSAVLTALGVPLLQEIPVVTDGSVPERQSDGDSQGVIAECYRNLRTAILFQMGRQKVQSLLVTSAVPGEGKTTTSINLAAAFAQTDRKVLLIDADLRRPRHSKVFGVPRSPGLSEVLAGEVELAAAIRRAPGASFDSLMSGSLPANPAALLASPKLPLILARLHQMYDTVVIDAPVILAVSDALVLSSHVSGTLYVSKPGSVNRTAFKRVKESLDRAGANVLGVVLTHVDPRDPYLYPSYLHSPYAEEEDSGQAIVQS